MAARPRFSEDDAYLFHSRKTAVVHYTPFPAHLLSQLARLSRLLRHAPNEAEAAWLSAQIDALIAQLNLRSFAVLAQAMTDEPADRPDTLDETA